MGEIADLVATTFPDMAWDPEDKPIVILDGRPYPVTSLASSLEGETAHVVGVNDKSFEELCARLRVETLHFYEMRVGDLAALEPMSTLRRLAVRWNTKLSSVEPLRRLIGLEVLVLEDTPRLRDLTPLSHLSSLRALAFSGGVWNKNKALSLEPLSGLSALEELELTNLSVEEQGLRPLAKCRALRTLRLSNQFPTPDYAYLSVHLPETECDLFAATVPLKQTLDGKDTMVVGKRKPMLSSSSDQGRLERYENEFSRLKRKFQAEMSSQR